MRFAPSERARLCDLLLEVGPTAPTLCEGWDTHDLAAHLWVRETDPIGAAGIVAKPLAGLNEQRMAQTRERWTYPELVGKLRGGPAGLSLFAIPVVDEAANAVEFFVHHEDVRRAGPDDVEPRDLGPEFEDFVWKRLGLMGRAMLRGVGTGLVLERDDVPGAHDTVRVSPGELTATLVGRPSELLLLAMGRTRGNRTRRIGEPEALAALDEAGLTVDG